MCYLENIRDRYVVDENIFSKFQGSYASGKCQGNLKFFKVREFQGILCCVREK